MLGRTYDAQNCSIARALEVVGERWSLLIMRDAIFMGVTRFSDFQRRLGLAANILATRLDGFVAAGLMERRKYSEHPDHYEYLLTEKGRAIQPVLVALTMWGDRWAAPDGPPVVYEHAGCGGEIEQAITCSACAESLHPDHVVSRGEPQILPRPTASRRERPSARR
ncbi:helix-turn-helix transcriptional regulator [Nocardia terpenica]|uniref:Transcriptional regulator n=1 Tax=Nocardia terpenica TaxID=455432 RepID=A0A164MDI4_9NOCA|nr:helix-turn-helix domain-containing protein [Nocardia terpenica]ATL67436.1 transcriptional regulator [Nocardia terpenica]KZM73262.1 HxlR family transcriptional regulator [Nocardia terpenica]MBF6064128.1 helix-turn-helix transcriptional regulator [Nocardia terpenica]MBF6106461.1 helix-turn-helix transcriptional regulator [Nocardia terpenica]MBF6113746.1 helix-turn-helix transcriptional regulator [Nocardia terpenica]